jgi:UDP-N-acetylglucosamine 2-epimerase (non-hydrolysing)
VVSDSGTITEESSILGIRSLNLRKVHERPEGNEEAVTYLSGVSKANIIRGINLNALDENLSAQTLKDYIVTDFSTKMRRIVASYYHYVDLRVWGKNI